MFPIKQFLLFCILLFACNYGHAQNSFSNTGSGINRFGDFKENEDSVAVGNDDEMSDEGNTKKDPLADVQLDFSETILTVSNLPERGYIVAHVTTSNGDIILEKSLKTNKNTIDIHQLNKGLYFVTITFKKYRKAFPIEKKKGLGKAKIEGADNLN